MVSREAWAERIPHAGSMCLLDVVLAWDATTIHAAALSRSTDHPLQCGAGLHAVHLAEYGAQATAVHGVLSGNGALRHGRLVSLRDVILTDEYVELSAGDLDVHAQSLYADQHGVQYHFEISQRGRVLASGRVAVMYGDD